MLVRKENILVISLGPLTGTLAPSTARYTIASKSPLTGGIGYANAGGHFAPELAYAGYDAIFIHGKSKNPVYLLIKDNHVELKDVAQTMLKRIAGIVKAKAGLLYGGSSDELRLYAQFGIDEEKALVVLDPDSFGPIEKSLQSGKIEQYDFLPVLPLRLLRLCHHLCDCMGAFGSGQDTLGSQEQFCRFKHIRL